MSRFSADIPRPSWFRQRELGQRVRLKYSNEFCQGLYTAVLPFHSWGEEDEYRNTVHGGIFDLKFSPNGSLLVATCEKNSILVFDPLSRNLIHTVQNAHNDCVINARFLDSHIFATGSDDNTVALWDVRNLKTRIRSLTGHANSVQNIEYLTHDDILVTSAFDGSICTWDINQYSDRDLKRNVVFQTSDLMRMRITPDGSKMVISTTTGYLMVVHNLDMKTLAQDLCGFHPNLYRTTVWQRPTNPWVANFGHLFSKKRKTNRVELITDFPKGEKAKVISSLEVHPQGWCVLSRSITERRNSEWTCIHDVRIPAAEAEDSDSDSEWASPTQERGAIVAAGGSEGTRRLRGPGDELNLLERTFSGAVPMIMEAGTSAQHAASTHRPEDLALRPEDAVPPHREKKTGSEENALEEAKRARGILKTAGPGMRIHISNTNSDWNTLINSDASNRCTSCAARECRGTSAQRDLRLSDGATAPSESSSADGGVSRRFEVDDSDGENVQIPHSALAIASARNGQDRAEAGFLGDNRLNRSSFTAANPRSLRLLEWRAPTTNAYPPEPVNSVLDRRMLHIASIPYVAPLIETLELSARLQTRFAESLNLRHRIPLFKPRLTHYIGEPSYGKWYPKELSFSSDGRIICSPFSCGVRLFAFSDEFVAIPNCIPGEPLPLYKISKNIAHLGIVLSSRFSPHHFMLVTGCIGGNVVWHQPCL